MTVVVEIMHYLLRQLIDEGQNITEEQSYDNFKSLLLSHAIHRPPHSMAILTLEDLKKVDIFVQSSFFKHFEMYRHILTVKDAMTFKTDRVFTHTEQLLPKVEEGKVVNFKVVPELNEFFSVEEQEAIKREQEYHENGPGKIEKILNEEMDRLAQNMEVKIA